MSDFLSDFMSDFLPDIFVRHVLVRFFSDFLIPFHVRFLPDFCPIFYVRFSLSDFFVRNFCSTCSCPIFFDRFFYPIFVRFILSDVFMTGFLSYFLCPIFARFDVSSFCPIFCPLFWPICCHIFCVISLQKRWNMSRHVMPPLSCTINVLVFLLLWQYRIHVWVWYSSSHQWLRGFGRDPGTLRNSLRLEKKTSIV